MKPPISKPMSILVVKSIAIDHHMVVIHVHIEKNLVDDELLDDRLGVNIIMEKLRPH
jgi:transcription initiation factor IIE alpha subunit